MTLGDVKVGSTVTVTKIAGDSAYKRRIMDMGYNGCFLFQSFLLCDTSSERKGSI